jgi:hypothetical protein
MTPVRRALGAALLVAMGAGAWHFFGGAIREQRVESLDPAKVQLIRTPGGLLEVSAMDKVEDFGWRTSWDCPVVDCSSLPRTVSSVRVKAHFVYQIPLAEEWRLVPEGDHYKLTVPPLQLRKPVAFDTGTMEILTTEASLLSPAAAANRENAIRYLGPELAQRGTAQSYVDAQQKNAEQTVREFAQKWMIEQGKKPTRPVRVVFAGPAPM